MQFSLTFFYTVAGGRRDAIGSCAIGAVGGDTIGSGGSGAVGGGRRDVVGSGAIGGYGVVGRRFYVLFFTKLAEISFGFEELSMMVLAVKLSFMRNAVRWADHTTSMTTLEARSVV